MNTKSFIIGFTAMDAIIRAAKATVHAQDTAQEVKTVITSFFAGAKQAVKYHRDRRNTCRMLTHVHSNKEQGDDY